MLWHAHVSSLCSNSSSLDGYFLRVNRSLCQILGYTKDELVGSSVKELSHPEDRDLTDAERERVREGDLETARFEKRYLRKNGAVVWVDLAVALESQDRAAALAAARRAVELDPNGISARVAFLVLSYDKDDPAKTFGQLGPLLQQTDGNTEIRFHLGVLSLWIGLRDKALGEFRQVAKDKPDGPYARFANAFVAELEKPA